MRSRPFPFSPMSKRVATSSKAGLIQHVPAYNLGVGPIVPLRPEISLSAKALDFPTITVGDTAAVTIKGGMVKIGTAIIGRVADVYVSLNDEVEENELLLKLDDAEARARLAAAETQADVREKTREKRATPQDDMISFLTDVTYQALGRGCGSH